jgi:hypothetical protein
MGGQVSSVELDSIGGRVQDELDVLWLGWLIETEGDVSQVSSLNLLVWKAHVVQVAEDVGSNKTVEGVNTSS